MARKHPQGELKGFGKIDAKYIEQSDTMCPSCKSSTSVISDSNKRGFVKTCDSSKCGWYKILYGAVSFDGEWKVGVLGDFEGHEEGKLGADKVATYTLDNGKIVEVYECYTIMNKEGMMTGKRIDFYDLFDKEGCLNEGEPWWPEEGVPSREVVNDVFGAVSFEARDDDFKEMNWTFDDLEESEREGPSVLRPERTYERAIEDIEDMIDRVMERLYYFRKMYYIAKKERNRKAMYLAIRNFKALEGVNQALRWTLGEKGVGHPLY